MLTLLEFEVRRRLAIEQATPAGPYAGNPKRATARPNWRTVSIEALETQLNDFDPAVRARALAELVALAEQGEVPYEPERDVANMHCHTFFSFNAYGYSPTGLAWLARRRGFRLMGIVDFDVLDGVDEFLAACDLVGVRGSAGIETRIYIPEFATREINSPGEPGIFYHMGIGFISSHVPEEVAPILAAMRERADRRNRSIIERVNEYLAPVAIDYERDVLPLTPGGNPTERHIVAAYVRAAECTVSDIAGFWGEKLGISEPGFFEKNPVSSPAFHDLIRLRLMKRGGVGYVRPTPETFPTVEEVNRLIVACGALPCATWLDGTSEGEQAAEELLNLLIGKGVVALNFIPDRCWNVADPEVKRVKLANMYAVAQLARDLELPLNVGTEMNSFGQKVVDDFDAPELAPLREAFLDGAYFVYGHTALQRALGLGCGSAWAQTHLPTRRERNAFYTQVGRLVPPGQAGLARLRRFGPDVTPEGMLSRLKA